MRARLALAGLATAALTAPTSALASANAVGLEPGLLTIAAGAGKRAPTGALAEAASAAQPSLAEVIFSPRPASAIALRRPAGLSAAQAKKVKPSRRIQAALHAHRYGLPVTVKTTPGVKYVGVAAAVTLQKQAGGKQGKVTTQQITLPPAVVGVGGAAGSSVTVLVPVDDKATRVMTKRDVTNAAISVTAIEIRPTRYLLPSSGS